jgi:hypothetical protein
MLTTPRSGFDELRRASVTSLRPLTVWPTQTGWFQRSASMPSIPTALPIDPVSTSNPSEMAKVSPPGTARPPSPIRADLPASSQISSKSPATCTKLTRSDSVMVLRSVSMTSPSTKSSKKISRVLVNRRAFLLGWPSHH